MLLNSLQFKFLVQAEGRLRPAVEVELSTQMHSDKHKTDYADEENTHDEHVVRTIIISYIGRLGNL